MTSNSPNNFGFGFTGQLVKSNGIGSAPGFTTATYPSTATGTGKILRADGTNWVVTTATYPDTAGTSGNVMTSDGTNWTSAAAPAPPSAGYISGYVYFASNTPSNSAGTFAVAANDLWVCPWYVRNTISISQIGINVTANSGANTHCRIGLYNNGVGKPTTVFHDFGPVLTSSNGWVNVTGLSQSIPSGWYWVASHFESTPTMTIYNGLADIVNPVSGGTTNSNFCGSGLLYTGNAYGSGLPDLTSVTPNSVPLRAIITEVKIT